MTAIADLDTYLSLAANPKLRNTAIRLWGNNMTGNNMTSPWVGASGDASIVNSAPTSAVTLDNTTNAAILPAAVDSAQMFISKMRAWVTDTSASDPIQRMGILVYDRLSHQGGLSGTVAGAQTTNLPTAALTRYTDGIGVMTGIEIYSAVGTTITDLTTSYTSSGASGHASPNIFFGGATANIRVAQAFMVLPLASGDRGVQSVESVSLAASTVSAAGNFGVTLFKPLFFVPVGQYIGGTAEKDALTATFLSEIISGACIGMIGMFMQGSVAGPRMCVELEVIRS